MTILIQMVNIFARVLCLLILYSLPSRIGSWSRANSQYFKGVSKEPTSPFNVNCQGKPKDLTVGAPWDSWLSPGCLDSWSKYLHLKVAIAFCTNLQRALIQCHDLSYFLAWTSSFHKNLPSYKTTMVQLISIIASLYYYLLGFDYQGFSKSNIPDFLLWLQLWKWFLENTGTGRKCQSSSTLRACCSLSGIKFTHRLQRYFWNNCPHFRLWNQTPASPCVCPKPSTPPNTEEL